MSDINKIRERAEEAYENGNTLSHGEVFGNMTTEEYIKNYFYSNASEKQKRGFELEFGENLVKGKYAFSFYKYDWNLRISIFNRELENDWYIGYDLFNSTDWTIDYTFCNTMLDAIDYAISNYMDKTGLENISTKRLLTEIESRMEDK